MKNTLNIALRITMCAALLAFAGCNSPLAPPAAQKQKQQAGGGESLTVSINGAGAARTIVPAQSAFDEYDFVFVKQDSDFRRETTSASNPTTITGLQRGTYTVTVTGKLSGVAIAAKTVGNVEVSPAATGPLNIDLEPVKTGNGTFKLALTIDTPIQSATMTIPGTTTTGVNVKASPTLSTSLAAGTYTVNFTLNNGEENVTVTEILYVYAGLTSTYTKTFNYFHFLDGETAVLADLNGYYTTNTNSWAGLADTFYEHFDYLGAVRGGKTPSALAPAFARVRVGGTPGIETFTSVLDLKNAVDAALIDILSEDGYFATASERGDGIYYGEAEVIQAINGAGGRPNGSAFTLEIDQDDGTVIVVIANKYSVTIQGMTSPFDPDDLENWLKEQPGGGDPDDPIIVPPLPKSMILMRDWIPLLDAFNGAKKYVAIDLHLVTMEPYTATAQNTNTPAFNTQLVFDPYVLNGHGGEVYIVRLALPDTATHIAGEATGYTDTAFRRFDNLEEISATGVTTVGRNAFQEANNTVKSLKKVSFLGTAPLTFQDEAFRGCTTLESLTFLQNITTMSADVFNDITNSPLRNFTFAKDISEQTVNLLKESGNTPPFVNATFTLVGSTGNWTTAQNGKALLRGAGILSWYPTASGNISLDSDLGETITTIDNRAFRGDTALTGIVANSVTSIGNNAFNGCTNLHSLTFLQDISGDSGGVFTGCNITSLTFKNNAAESTVTFFKDSSSANNSPFENMIFGTVGGRWSVFDENKGLVLTENSEKTLFWYPSASGPVYLDSIITVAGKALMGNKKVTSIDAPGVTVIGKNAFDGCSILVTAEFAVATVIGDHAFQYCTSLTTASFPVIQLFSGPSGDDDAAFLGCTSLALLEIPSVTVIGSLFTFAATGSQELTIVMGNTAPALGASMEALFGQQPGFVATAGVVERGNNPAGTWSSDNIPILITPKSVVVRHPAGATGYDQAWANALKRGDPDGVTVGFETY